MTVGPRDEPDRIVFNFGPGGGVVTAARQRRLRQRQRDGVVVAPVDVGPDLVEALIDLQWLSPGVSDNRRAIGDAIGRMLADMAASWRRK